MSNSASIFSAPAPRGRPISRADREVAPRLALLPTETGVDIAPPLRESVASSDTTMITILDRANAANEPLLVFFARKEADLRAAFAALTVEESRALHKRLTISLPSDVLAQKFNRLTAERRARLIAFVADARRRAALANAKR